MENYKTFVGGRIGLILFTLGMFLVFQNAHAFNKTAPTHNVNLSPFEGWMSAFYCMNKTVPVPCSPKGQLTFSGIVDVAPSEKGDYCSDKTGCSKHALGVLECIHLVKRDFWFHNNATVDVLNRTIIDGCANKDNNSGISTVSYTSSGMKVYQKMYIPYVASLSSLAFIAVSNIM
ncbi:unnamed protein product [Prunus armeniaca]|uniref:DUF7731 domain-containing protein n=1 Tax=Prunus armeniaca TaxID=36596 RepID=A0A6J5XK59_PRUAR|nr:unnamed protein product [Prunus armeniaca]